MFESMATRQLPIFPLPVVLFPGTPQLLHIFEPQYRQMLADCEAGDRIFGISYLQVLKDGDTPPAIDTIGCMAHILAVRYLPDGRANIMTTGGDRYVLRSYIECDRLYRVAMVEPFDDMVDDEDLHELSKTVRDAFTLLTEAMAALSEQVTPPIELPDDARRLSFHVAAALDVDGNVKQQLLELRSTAVRLRHLEGVLRRLNADVAQRVGHQVQAKRNGKTGNTVSLDR